MEWEFTMPMRRGRRGVVVFWARWRVQGGKIKKDSGMTKKTAKKLWVWQDRESRGFKALEISSAQCLLSFDGGDGEFCIYPARRSFTYSRETVGGKKKKKKGGQGVYIYIYIDRHRTSHATSAFYDYHSAMCLRFLLFYCHRQYLVAVLSLS